MKKSEWQTKYNVSNIDMELIDDVVKSGGKISEVENPVLDYDIIKLEMRK